MKTPLTREIEKALFNWQPATISGIKVNKFRKGFAATEVPVECGTTKAGLVDFVWVQECLEHESTVGGCMLSSYEKKYSDPSQVCETAIKQGCAKHPQNIEFKDEVCDDNKCLFHTNKTKYENTIVFTCVEIKITKADFHSSHGHNFCGNLNYYALPAELYSKVKELIPDGIGVLLFYHGEKPTERKQIDSSYPFWGIRKKIDAEYFPLDEETQKWMTLSVAKRAFKEQQMREKENCEKCKRRKENADVWS